jgi:hypothetical protein
VFAPDSYVQKELGLPPGAVVQFKGQQPLALDARTNNATVPARFLHHPLVEGRYFFALPRYFWNGVSKKLGSEVFDPKITVLEETLAGICYGNPWNVGFWKGRVFSYSHLRERPLWVPSAEEAAAVGWDVNQARLDRNCRAYEDRNRVFTRVARAYVGWLLTNGTFLDEHDALLATWRTMVRRWGFDRLGVLPMTGMFLPGDDPTADASWLDYRAAFNEFFARWRLLGLAAPYLPIPLEPLMTGSLPMSAVAQLQRSGGIFCLPDTFPVPSRDTLRNLLDDALHGSGMPEHLREWRKLIARENPAKKPLRKFARILEIQHYWRILHHRHPKAIRGRLGELKKAIALFLGVKPGTVHRDLLWIRKRLGPDWADRGRGYPAGPF